MILLYVTESYLTRKDVSFLWDTGCEEAFTCLKQKVLEPPVLAYPVFDGTEFILQTDASLQGLGYTYILAQKQDNKELVIFAGGRLSRGYNFEVKS